MPNELDELLSPRATSETDGVFEIPEWDDDAPELDAFPPRIFPGTYAFEFFIPEGQEAVEWKTTNKSPKRTYLSLTYTARIPLSSVSPEQAVNPSLLANGDEFLDLGYQRASFLKAKAMPISFAADLMRKLGITLDVDLKTLSPEEAKNELNTAFRMASRRRARGFAVIGWEAYDRDAGEVLARTAKKRDNWPTDENGKPQLFVKSRSGKAVYGKETVIRLTKEDNTE